MDYCSHKKRSKFTLVERSFFACVWRRVRLQIFHGRKFSAQRPAGERAAARAARGTRAGCADARGVDRDSAADGIAGRERGAGRSKYFAEIRLAERAGAGDGG